MTPPRFRSAELFVFTGQSHMLLPASAPVPSVVMAGLERAYTVEPTPARAGTSWVQRTSRAARDVDRHLGAVAGTSWLLDAGGSTDIVLNPSDAAAIFANAETYWQARLDAGWDRIIAATVPDATSYNGTQDATRAALNDLIRGSSLLDDVADWADLQSPPANDPGDLSDASDLTYFNSDVGLQHFTELGAAEAGAEFLLAIERVRAG